MMSMSARAIWRMLSLTTRSSSASPLSTTSGLMRPPHAGHLGTPVVSMIHSAEYTLPHS